LQEGDAPWQAQRSDTAVSDTPSYFHTAEVAATLQVSPKTVSRWAKEGKLPFLRTLGGHRRYRPPISTNWPTSCRYHRQPEGGLVRLANAARTWRGPAPDRVTGKDRFWMTTWRCGGGPAPASRPSEGRPDPLAYQPALSRPRASTSAGRCSSRAPLGAWRGCRRRRCGSARPRCPGPWGHGRAPPARHPPLGRPAAPGRC
jgi:excisionase family DNA binding protein